MDHLLILFVLLRGGLDSHNPLSRGASVIPLLGGGVDLPRGVLIPERLFAESGFRLSALLGSQSPGLRSLHGPFQLGFRQIALAIPLLVPLDKILGKFRGEREFSFPGVLDNRLHSAYNSI